MHHQAITPAQIRAGRALLGWPQDELAKEAGVALSTVRDTESEKRAGDTAAVENMRRALWNGGVVFVPGRQDEGPGVRLVANWPHIIRRPTTMQKWEGMPFAVEWQGKVITVFVSFEVICDLDGHGNTTDAEYLKTFDRHRGKILDAFTLAVRDPANFDVHGRLHIRSKDIAELEAGQWHKVVWSEEAAHGLMNKFASRFIEAGIPRNVEVYRDTSNTSAFVYYFSPGAFYIAREMLEANGATACTTAPDVATMRKARL